MRSENDDAVLFSLQSSYLREPARGAGVPSPADLDSWDASCSGQTGSFRRDFGRYSTMPRLRILPCLGAMRLTQKAIKGLDRCEEGWVTWNKRVRLTWGCCPTFGLSARASLTCYTLRRTTDCGFGFVCLFWSGHTFSIGRYCPSDGVSGQQRAEWGSREYLANTQRSVTAVD